MSTSAKLASLGVTLIQARDFIMANISSPATIYQVAMANGINSQMLADILSTEFPGITALEVEHFFNQRGLSPAGLQSPSDESNSARQLMPLEFAELSAVVRPNERTGTLSNESIRATVAAVTGLDTYKFAFAPFNFQGHEDGIFSGEDLGVAGLAPFKATWENMESLWLGTALNMLEAIDVTEMASIEAFITDHEALLVAEDPATLDTLFGQIVQMYITPAENPALTPEELLDMIVSSHEHVVRLIGLNSEEALLFDFSSRLIDA